MAVKISPSILSADFANLKMDIEKVAPASDMLHVDVMDGHFVPNITIGVPVVKSLKKATDIPLDVHLMISDPLEYIQAFADAGAEILNFHVESNGEPSEIVRKIKEQGVKVGATLKPGTPVEKLDPILSDLDLALVMTVEPGFSGQSFMDMTDKIKYIRDKEPDLDLQVDGGINLETGRKVVDAGANVLVSGSFIFGSEDPLSTAQSLRELK